MRRVLLTGARGFLGRQALPLLEARGYEVHAVTRRASGRGDMGACWHAADLLDVSAAEALVEHVAPTDLLHLAWYTEPGAYWQSPKNYLWLEASSALLRRFADSGGRRAVLAGTCAEYDWAGTDERLAESRTPLAPRGAYGEAKDALRRESERVAAASGLSVAWARLFFLFGAGEHPGRLVPSVARALLEGRPAPCSDGRQVRDYLSSRQAASALVALLASEVTGVVNVASGRPTPVRELVELAAAAVGRPELLRIGAVPSRPDEPARIVADVHRLRQEVGWTPDHGLRPDVVEAVDWWRGRDG